MFDNYFLSLSQHIKNDEGILCKKINCLLFLVNAFIKHIITYSMENVNTENRSSFLFSSLHHAGDTIAEFIPEKQFAVLRSSMSPKKVIWIKIDASFSDAVKKAGMPV